MSETKQVQRRIPVQARRVVDFRVEEEDGAPLRFIRRFGTGALAGTRVYPPAVPVVTR